MSKSYLWLEQVFENRLVALVLATTVIVPLVATPADNNLHGVAALAFEGLGLLLLAVLLWRSKWNLSRESVTTFLRTGANLPILAFLGLVGLSCAMSPHKQQSAQELLRTGVGVLLYFVVSNQFRRAHYLAKLIDTLIYLAIVSSLIGFAHYATSKVHNAIAIGQFGDHQLFGSFLMVLLPLLIVSAVTETRRNRQVAAQIATVLTITCLLLTQARSAWVGTLVALVVMVLLSAANQNQRNKWQKRKHQWVMPFMLVLASVGLFLTLMSQPGSNGITKDITNRAVTLSLTQVEQEHGWQYRLGMWTGALKMIAEHPLGVGTGLFPYYESKYTGMGNRLSFNDHKVSLGEQAHSLYLQTAAELGLPGLLLLVTSLVTFMISGVRRIRVMHSDFRRNLLIASLASTAAFAVDAFASPSWQFGQVMMFAWIILGMGAGCMQSSTEQEEVEPELAVPARATRPLTAVVCLGMAFILPTSMLSAQAIYLPPPPISAPPGNDTGAIAAGAIGGAAIIGGAIAGTVSSGGGAGSTASNAHLLRPGDVIDVLVSGHEDLTANAIIVRQDGKVKYAPVNAGNAIDDLQAAGVTPMELGGELHDSLVQFGKIDRDEQVIVRLNPAHLAREARIHHTDAAATDKPDQSDAVLNGNLDQGADQTKPEARDQTGTHTGL